jgi:hypothetical protein
MSCRIEPRKHCPVRGLLGKLAAMTRQLGEIERSGLSKSFGPVPGFAIALVSDSDLLALDEPTVARIHADPGDRA